MDIFERAVADLVYAQYPLPWEVPAAPAVTAEAVASITAVSETLRREAASSRKAGSTDTALTPGPARKRFRPSGCDDWSVRQAKSRDSAVEFLAATIKADAANYPSLFFCSEQGDVDRAAVADALGSTSTSTLLERVRSLRRYTAWAESQTMAPFPLSEISSSSYLKSLASAGLRTGA